MEQTERCMMFADYTCRNLGLLLCVKTDHVVRL
jgi:hypothetical protein